MLQVDRFRWRYTAAWVIYGKPAVVGQFTSLWGVQSGKHSRTTFLQLQHWA